MPDGVGEAFCYQKHINTPPSQAAIRCPTTSLPYSKSTPKRSSPWPTRRKFSAQLASVTCSFNAMEAIFDTSVPWYDHEAPKLQREFRELITNYANIQPKDVEKHVQTVRDKAWRVVSRPMLSPRVSRIPDHQLTIPISKAPFPCVGSYLFAELALFKLPAYPTILNRLNSNPSSVYLEVGCGLAQDLRKLIADGAPAAQLRGTDLQAGLMASGHDLFLDAEKLPLSDGGDVQGKTFVAADFLDDSDNSPLKAWECSADIVHASMFLHCFELPTQVRACKRIVALLRPQAGSLFVGRTAGVSLAAGGPREEEVKGPLGQIGGVKETNYLHDVESFRGMWEQVGRGTETRWEVEVVEEEIDDGGGKYFSGAEHRWLRFEVVRL